MVVTQTRTGDVSRIAGPGVPDVDPAPAAEFPRLRAEAAEVTDPSVAAVSS